MATLYVPIGIPGCGKTTYGRHLGCTALSSDSIREELFGDEAVQYDEGFAKQWALKHDIVLNENDGEEYERQVKSICRQAVFGTLFDRTRGELIRGNDVYYDATNLNAKRRTKLLKTLARYYDEAIAIYFNLSYDLCCKRNQSRARVVPDDVMRHMRGQLQAPTLKEGFSEIRTIFALNL